jgi:cytochrome c553
MAMLKRNIQIFVLLFFICLAMLLSASSRANIQKQQELTSEDSKEAVKSWVTLCAPCHSVQGTGTDYGPPLVGPKARRYTYKQLIAMFSNPEGHGIPEASPALRKLTVPQRSIMASWLLSLKVPEDIVVTSDMVVQAPAPFIFLQNCAGCHGPDGRGGIGKNLHGICDRRKKEDIIKLIADPRSAGLNNIMPAFDELSEEERTEIAEWLYTLK